MTIASQITHNRTRWCKLISKLFRFQHFVKSVCPWVYFSGNIIYLNISDKFQILYLLPASSPWSPSSPWTSDQACISLLWTVLGEDQCHTDAENISYLSQTCCNNIGNINTAPARVPGISTLWSSYKSGKVFLLCHAWWSIMLPVLETALQLLETLHSHNMRSFKLCRPLRKQ